MTSKAETHTSGKTSIRRDTDSTDATTQSDAQKQKQIQDLDLEAELAYAGQLNDKRLWIGNLDPRVTEFELIKLFRVYGAIQKLDFLFHKTGPLANLPRGYAFLTFEDRSSPIKARQALDGKKLYSRPMLVKAANRVCKEDLVDEKGKVDIPALRGAKTAADKSQASIDSKIYAIEAKLKSLDQQRQLGDAGSTRALGISPLSRLAVAATQPKPPTFKNRSHSSQGPRKGPYNKPYSKH